MSICPAQASFAGAVPHGVTVSTSKQFYVQAEDRALRSSAASFAETIRQQWLDALALKSDPEIPIWIYFPADQKKRPRQGAALNFLVGDGNTLRLQLTVWEPKWVGTAEMAEWVFQALAAEYTARYHPPEVNRSIRLAPPWFVQGLLQQWLAKREAPPVQVLEGLLSGTRPPTAAGVLRQRALPGSLAEITAFRLLSLGIWRTLEAQPEGKRGLRELAGSLARQELDATAVLSAFPSLGGQAERLERQWVLALAKMAYTTRVNQLNIAETAAQLRRILALEGELQEKKGAPAEKVAGPLAMLALAGQRGGQRALANLSPPLLQLELRANPLLQPVVREYRLIAETLARKPKSKLRKRIEENLALEQKVAEWGDAIADALNEFSVNRQGAPDPAFQQMLRVQNEGFTPPPRRDAITRAVDAAAEKYHR